MPHSSSVILQAQRPRYSLQRKIILWTVLLAVVPTVACAVWLNTIAHGLLKDNHARNVAVLARTLSSSLTGRLGDGWSAQAAEALDGLRFDPRLAFVIITDAENRPLHRRTPDPEAWQQYQDWRHWIGPDISTETDRPILLGNRGDLVAWRVPVFNRSVGGDAAGPATPQRLEGFLTVALREQTMPQTIARLRTWQLAAACVVCVLCLPAVLWAVKRWTAPLRDLIDATVRFGSGEEPRPVSVSTQDEIGLLAVAFNEMTANLAVARHELELANEELEEKVLQRTAELEAVNSKLKMEIEDKNDFLRAVSHDLNAPLRNIGGLATMLLMKYKADLGEDAVEKLERINDSVKSQTALLHDLLELSRIRTQRGRQEPVDCGQIVAELAKTLSYDLERARIELEIDDDLPTIRADKNRIRQVFQNLLDNAIKYMGEDEPRRIELRYRQEARLHRFELIDTGRGIAADDLPKVFQVFQRGIRSGVHLVQGRGVGLANVKAIIETLGGTIDVTSQQGRGSTFIFTIDRAMTAVDREPDAEPDAEDAAADNAHAAG